MEIVRGDVCSSNTHEMRSSNLDRKHGKMINMHYE